MTMHNLHAIYTNPTALFWVTYRGASGRPVDHGQAHLLRVSRGTPSTERWARESWTPYRLPNEGMRNATRGDTLNTVCGLRTTARWPHATALITERSLWIDPVCERCASTTNVESPNHFRSATLNNDPWITRLRQDYGSYILPDPISGL